MGAHRWRALLERGKPPPGLALSAYRGYMNPSQVLSITITYLHWRCALDEASHQEWNDHLTSRTLGELSFQPPGEGTLSDVRGHHVISGLTFQADIELVDSCLRNFKACGFSTVHIDLEPDASLSQVRARLVTIVIPGGFYGQLEQSRSGQLTQRHREGGKWPLRRRVAVLSFRRPGPQQETLGNKHVGAAVVQATGKLAIQSGEDVVVNSLKILPGAHSAISSVALDETKLCPHRERFEWERLVGNHLAYEKICLGQQVGSIQYQLVGSGLLVEPLSELNTEALNTRLLRLIDQAQIERLFGDLEIGLHHLWHQEQRVLVVPEALFRNAIGWQRFSQEVLHS